MSDLAAAAAALGLPESLVQRSADARAAETGASVDEILAAWGGGAPAPAAAPPPAATAEPPAEAPGPEPQPAESETVVEVPTAEPAMVPVAAAAGPYKAPTLVGAEDNPGRILIGAVVLFAMMFLIAVLGPSIQAETPGARSSDIPYTAPAEAGQVIYMELACASCHTQMVRPVIADVGLGAVTLNDTNQILGTRRFGPDLSNVGARIGPTEVQAVIEGRLGNHPQYRLSTDDMNQLVAYLVESVTAEETP